MEQSKFTVKAFVEMFNEIKTAEKGRKGTTKGLSDKDEREFKKLIKRGFDENDFRLAITQMFRDPDQWAVSTGNDIPTHFLRPDNFNRYHNTAINIEEKKPTEEVKEEEVETAKEIKKRKEAEEKEKAEMFIQEAKELYSVSLKTGRWEGSEFHAHVIGLEFKELIDQETKTKLWNDILSENQQAERFNRSLVIGKIMQVKTKFINPKREFSNRVIIEAVKRNIKEPWKR